MSAHGYARVTRVLAAYRPASPRALALSIGADMEQESLGLYIADVLWLLLKAKAGDRVNIKPFSEARKRQSSKEAQKAENEIIVQKAVVMLDRFLK